MLYADVIGYTGWLPSQVDGLTLPEVTAYLARWREHHPIRQLQTLLAVGFRLRPASSSGSSLPPAAEDDCEGLINAMRLAGMPGSINSSP